MGRNEAEGTPVAGPRKCGCGGRKGWYGGATDNDEEGVDRAVPTTSVLGGRSDRVHAGSARRLQRQSGRFGRGVVRSVRHDPRVAERRARHLGSVGRCIGRRGRVSPPVPAVGQPAAVDLAFTGTLVFVAKGPGGSCTPGKGTDGAVTFGFEASDVDFPGLGSSFSASESRRDYVGIKWIVDPNRAFGNTAATKITLSPDHHSIQLDTDLGGPGPEHVKGTITCP